MSLTTDRDHLITASQGNKPVLLTPRLRAIKTYGDLSQALDNYAIHYDLSQALDNYASHSDLEKGILEKHVRVVSAAIIANGLNRESLGSYP